MNSSTLDSLILSSINSIEFGSNTERNRAITIKYFGLDGKGGTSMQDAGSEYGLTRESVRQITNKMAGKLKESIKIPAKLKDAIQTIDSNTPSSAENIEDLLTDKKITSKEFKVEGILNIAKILGYKTKPYQVIKHNKKRFIVGERHSFTAQLIESLAISEISHNGAVSLEQLSKEVDSTPKSVKLSFAKDVISTIEELKWVDNEETWLFFKDRGRNRLLKRLEQIFSVYKEVSISDLQEAISRNWNKNKNRKLEEIEQDLNEGKTISKKEMDRIKRKKKGLDDKEAVSKVLDEKVMSEFIKASGFYTIDNNGVIKSIENIDNPELIKEAERKIIDLIINSEEGYCREKELEDNLVLKKKDKWNFSVALNYSPLIVRQDRGVYKLTGKIK